MTTKEAFLDRVRKAVMEGNRAGTVPPLPERGRVGYQGAGPDPVARFCQELTGAGGNPHLAPDRESVWKIIRQIIAKLSIQKIVLGQGGLVDQLDLADGLRGAGFQVTKADKLDGQDFRDAFFAADLGISNVAYLVAETGSVVMASKPEEPRSLSLLPPIHIAIAHKDQIIADLFDLFDLFSPLSSTTPHPPSCLTLITGPSKTGDIELKLVTGVHGPGEIHVIVCVW